MASEVGADRLAQSLLFQHVEPSPEPQRTVATVAYEDYMLRQEPLVNGISSFCRLTRELNVQFQPRTPERPWAVTAGRGGTALVECHRYVPGQQYNNFNDVTKDGTALRAHRDDPTRSGQYYAVKRLNFFKARTLARASSQDHEATEYDQFTTELRVLAYPPLRSHENILRLLGLAHYLAEPLLVLEDCDCGNLPQFLQSDLIGPRRWLEVKMNLCQGIARGLEVLHQHGIIHGDIKDTNILVTQRDKTLKITTHQHFTEDMSQNFIARICDFGFSLILSDHTTETLFPKGWSMYWAAPEVFPGRPPIPVELLPRLDVFAAGLVFASVFLEGNHIYNAGLQNEESLPQEKVLRLIESDESLVDHAVDAITRYPMIVDDHAEKVSINFGLMYCDRECNIFREIFQRTLRTDPRKRIPSGRDLVQLLDDVWFSKRQQTNTHWRVCTGAIGDYSRISRKDLPVTTELEADFSDIVKKFLASALGEAPKPCPCRTTGPSCRPLPRMFEVENGFADGVLDLRTSFRSFRATFTEELKDAVLEDMIRNLCYGWNVLRDTETDELEHATNDILKSAKADLASGFRKYQHLYAKRKDPSRKAGARSADCAYQLAIAFLESFGVRYDREATAFFMLLAWKMGSVRAYSDLNMVSGALYRSIVPNASPLRTLTASISKDAVVERLAERLILHLDFTAARNSTQLDAESQRSITERSRAFLVDNKMTIWTRWAKKPWGRVFTPSSPVLGFFANNAPRDISPFRGNLRTMLHYAAMCGRVDVVKNLVEEYHADTGLMDEDGWTAFDYACFAGDTGVAEYLLRRNERTGNPFPGASCPLQNIVCLPKNKIREFIERVIRLNGEAVVHARNTHNMTALTWAMQDFCPLYPGCQDAAVEILLSHGANPVQLKKENSLTALMIATIELKPQLVRMMTNALAAIRASQTHGTLPNPAHEMGRSLARLIVLSKSQLILAGGQDYEEKISVILDALTIDEVLVEFPKCQPTGYDVLGYVCYYNNVYVTRWLIKRFPNLQDRFPDTFDRGIGEMVGLNIMCAYTEMVTLILSFSKNHPQLCSRRVLHDAMNHQPSLVRWFFEALKEAGGQDALSERGLYGATVFDVALQYGNEEVMDYLLVEGATYDEYRLDPDFRVDQSRCSPLALVLGYEAQVNYLLDLDPKPRLIVTESGINAFHVLASKESVLGAEYGTNLEEQLEIFHELEPSLIDHPGGAAQYRPFHMVALHYASIVGQFLHERGADINAPDARGRTPLDLLLTHGSPSQTFNFRPEDGGGSAASQARFICDYALGGPIYWERERRHFLKMVPTFRAWGAKTSEELVREMFVD